MNAVNEVRQTTENGRIAPHQIALAGGLMLLATACLVVAPLLWHAPRCTGATQADRCPLAGTANTNVHGYPR